MKTFHVISLMALAVGWGAPSVLPSAAAGATALAVQGGRGRGGGPAQPAGPQLPMPMAFPLPGTYTNTTGVGLLSREPGAEVHYTTDGSNPTAASPVFDQHQVLFLTGVYDGDRGLRTGYTIRAIATKDGFAPSAPATFTYFIDRRDRTEYVSEMVAPGVRMIRDSDNDKMFLVEGTEAFALIDSGLGRGDLKAYLDQFTGGRPIHAIFTHSHGDHTGQAYALTDGTLAIGAGDRQGLVGQLERREVPADVVANVRALDEGDTVDLGDRALVIHATPGHTPGSIVIFDPKTGALFTGDSIGNNSPLPPDLLWMQGSRQPLDEYFAVVLALRHRIGDSVRLIMTGHNDRPLIGTRYLVHVEAALQDVMDRGEAALTPSVRPPNGWQAVIGDRMSDPDWFGLNVNRETFLPAPPDQIASLVDLRVMGATLSESVSPRTMEYTAVAAGSGPVTVAVRPASSRVSRITIDGRPATAGNAVTVGPAGQGRTIPIVITAADGETQATYQLTVTPR